MGKITWLALAAPFLLARIVAFEPARPALDLERPFSGYALTAAFPGVEFNQPVGTASPPGETNRLFVYERSGLIWVITNLSAPNRTLFLDPRKGMLADHIETGLLGMAFHPNFKTNGHFFISRTMFSASMTHRLSRFTVSAADPNRADPAETVLIDHADVNPSHNGGDLHFGPDGYLYYSVGDYGPSLPDRRALPQAIDGGLFAGIFRIDVDSRLGSLDPTPHPSVHGHYAIPADNPFVGATSFNGLPVDPARVRTETFAVGLRNPWRFTFDSVTGDLIVGDVGEAGFEEINIVKPGGNYGWPYREGELTHENFPVPPEFTPAPPLHAYGRGYGLSQGSCVIGGLVCHNASIPDLEGWYIFGDERSGNIWRLRTSDPSNVRWLAREPGIVSYGRDPATGDVLAVNLTRGEIRRLIYTPPEEKRVPLKLSQSGIFTSLTLLTPAAGVVPFSINVPFWSDYAIKRRWFGLMNAQSKMTFAPTSNWTFPDGAIWVKHFELEMERGNAATARKIETRLMVKSGSEFRGFTYRWNEAGTDADLLPPDGLEEPFVIKDPGGILRTQVWVYPARGDCTACHTKEGGGALGFNTAQLNLEQRGIHGLENQLDQIRNANYFEGATIEPRNLPRLSKSSDTTAPLEHRVKSYLSVNCSHCHQFGGIWGATWNGNLLSAMPDSSIINGKSFAQLTTNAVVIAPHSLEDSMMFRRISEHDAFRMPPIGSTVIDERSRDLLRDWIMGMPDTSLSEQAIGGGTLRGSVTQRGGTRIVSGIGKAFSSNAPDRLHLLSGPLARSGHVVARVAGIPGLQPGIKAGVIIRQSDGTNPATAWLARDGAGKNQFTGRSRDGGDIFKADSPAEQGPSWLRLIRRGDSVSAWESFDGVDWEKIDERSFTAEGETIAGVAVASGEDWRHATVEFDQVQILSGTLTLIDPAPNTPLPRDLRLEADVATNGVTVARVEFFADGHLLGAAQAAPWRLQWTNAWAGTYAVTARIVDQNGLSIDLEPLTVNFTVGPALAYYTSLTPTMENWRTNFGRIGRSIPAAETQMPPRTVCDLHGASPVLYDATSVLSTSDAPLKAATWTADSELRLAYRGAGEEPHLLSVHFAKYENSEGLLVTIHDAATSDLLDARTITDLANGMFVSWAVRGALDIRIRSTSALRPHLGGIFIDPLPRPSVELLPLPNRVTLPTTILLQAKAHAPSSEIQRVEFWNHDLKLGEDSEAPFEVTWTNIVTGEHSLVAHAVDRYGVRAVSVPQIMAAELPAASASFIGEDRRTQGDWIGPYGNTGHMLLIGWTNLPPTLDVGVQAATFGFSYSETNRSSLRRTSDSEDRFAGCYVVDASVPIEMRITPRNGERLQLGLYFLDWNGPGRSEAIELIDAITGTILDRRQISAFFDGAHLLWNVQGDLIVRVRSLNDYNTIVSAIFFDPPQRPSAFWFRETFPGVVESVSAWSEDIDADGRPNLAEFALGTNPFAADPPLSITATRIGEVLSVSVPATKPGNETQITLEVSDNLVYWRSVIADRHDLDGMIRFTAQIGESGLNYYRLRIEPPQL